MSRLSAFLSLAPFGADPTAVYYATCPACGCETDTEILNSNEHNFGRYMCDHCLSDSRVFEEELLHPQHP